MAQQPLNPPTVKSLNPQQISDNLNILYGADARISKYAPYFFLFKIDLDKFTPLSGFAIRYSDRDLPSDTFKPYGGPTLYLRAISALELKAPKVFSGSDGIYQAYIALDRKTESDGTAQLLVPYQIAKMLSSTFIYGLVTRLVIEKYKLKWQAAATAVYLTYPLELNAAPPPQGPAPTPVPAFNASDWCDHCISALVTKVTNPSNFKAATYSECLSAFTDSSLQVVGMAMGWLVGDALADATISNVTACKTAIWSLLNDNFTTEQIGTIVGYTFSYLSGYLTSERTRTLITSGDPGQPALEASTIYEDLSAFTKKIGESPTIDNNVIGVTNAFFNFALQDFYGAADDPVKAAPNWYFLKGFQEGLSYGADVMYRTIFAEAYELGFTVGFREGFAQGYSAGYAAGYGSGYLAGKSQNTWMSGLQNAISAFSALLSSNQASTLLQDASIVGTVIAELF